MATTAVLDVKLLRSSWAQEQALHLRHVLRSDPSAVSSISSQLLSLVSSDSLPPIVLLLWVSASRSPHAAVEMIRQEVCLSVQRTAINRFYRLLCREKTFAETWEAAGGAMGVAQLAAKLNLDGLRSLFNLLGATGRARGLRKERQTAMEELLTLLWGLDGNENAALDPRPLRDEYVKLLPACGGAFRLRWEEMKRQLPPNFKIDVETDPDFFEKYYDEKLQRNNISASNFLDEVKPLVIHRVDYGLDLLHRFANSETLLGASSDALFVAVIDPLSKRFSVKRRIADVSTMRFWSRVMLCLKENKAFRKEFNNSSEYYRRILARLVKVWNYSRAQAEYTEMLTTLFSLIPEVATRGYSLQELIANIAKVRRYQLLRLFLQHTAGFGFDIGEPASLEYSGIEKSSFRWPAELLFLLSADEAFVLWEKIQRAGKDVGFWGRHLVEKSLYNNRDRDNYELVDRHVMRAILLNRIQTISPFETTCLDTIRSDLRQEVPRRMKKATLGRLPEIRSTWAASALSLCVAIGDLELYAETLRWARRFNRDPLTVKELYGGSLFDFDEAATDLLVALPSRESSSTVSVGEISKRIQCANEVLQILFDTVIMCTDEPSFSGWWDWSNLFGLIHRVICYRLARVNDFQDQTKISDDALYEALWEPTSALLEKMLLNLIGPVGDKFDGRAYSIIADLRPNESQNLREPTIKFLNHMAEYYNSMWTELRLREMPDLVTADEMWPKGLAIQHLANTFGSALPYLPYAQSRIETVVFMNPLKLLQPVQVDEETQLAIGTFIDSWTAALEQYIRMPGKLDKEAQRKDRISKAWIQATVGLSKDRMSQEEAERFWWPIFNSVGVKKDEVGIDEKANERPEPSLPDADEDMQPIEWNPDPEYDRLSQSQKSKTLTPTYLDFLLSRPRSDGISRFIKPYNSAFGDVKCIIPGKPRPDSFWNSIFKEKSRMTGSRADAFATAGILAFNTEHGSGISLLKTPFPSPETVRIPAVYLDQEFLEREVQSWGFSSMLEQLKFYMPARLLAQLGVSVLESIRKREQRKPYDHLVWVINMILEGADPSLAIPLIQQFVLENPDASSWHRMLLNQKALIHFRPADAKAFFVSFTEAILDKLQEQTERRANQKPDDAAANKGPLVKVTTVKMLAQLLRESPVVDPGLAVELNIRILKRASHIDIRSASVKGLTEALANTTSAEIKKHIYDALTKYAAPIASSINESQPSTDWDALMTEDELPEVWKSDNGAFTTPPIMDLILRIGQNIDWQSEEAHAYKELVDSIFDASAENNRRWMKLFLQKHGFNMPDDAQLPDIPMFPTMLDACISMLRTETPAKYIDLARQYLLLRLKLPDWASAVTTAVRADQKLVGSNSGRHWSYLWNSDYDGFTTSLFRTMREHLSRIETQDANEKTQQDEALQSLLFEFADTIIMRGDLNKFERFLSETSSVDCKNPVWRRILKRIDGLRTSAWQADLDRKPAVLPDTLPLKIRMLDLPRNILEPGEAQEAATRCVNGAVELLHEIVSSGIPYYNSFGALQRALVEAEPKALMGIAIGSMPALNDANSVTLVDHLRAELAMALFERSYILRQNVGKDEEEDDVKKQAKELVMKMSNSSVENFRKLAAPSRASMENTTGWDVWS